MPTRRAAALPGAPPACPALILVITIARRGARSPLFIETRRIGRKGRSTRTHAAQLDAQDAHSLALRLLGFRPTRGLTRWLVAVARESHGSPFLVEELVLGIGAATLQPIVSAITPRVSRSQALSRLPIGRRLLENDPVSGAPSLSRPWSRRQGFWAPRSSGPPGRAPGSCGLDSATAAKSSQDPPTHHGAVVTACSPEVRVSHPTRAARRPRATPERTPKPWLSLCVARVGERAGRARTSAAAEGRRQATFDRAVPLPPNVLDGMPHRRRTP